MGRPWLNPDTGVLEETDIPIDAYVPFTLPPPDEYLSEKLETGRKLLANFLGSSILNPSGIETHITPILRKHLSTLLVYDFERNRTWNEVKLSVGSNHLGAINSSIGMSVESALHNILSRHDGYEQAAEDGKDFVYKNIEGDFKVGIARSRREDCFTANRSSHKKGYYCLIKLGLDDDVPLSEIRIMYLYASIIHTSDTYIDAQVSINENGEEEKSDSDRAAIKISCENADKACIMYGDHYLGNKRMNKCVQFVLAPL